MPHKIGMYVRVSTEEQAQVLEGSIENQQHRLKNFVDMKNDQEGRWGKVVEKYIDDGYSAKDTRRPAYQRMMRDIRAGKVNLILVADVSRLSRNIHDFCVLLKELEEHKAKFFSTKEQFDTSTPAGEMMIYNMINLAQFERKQTSERVSLNFHSRALRGLKNGGTPILGYDPDPNNTGRMIVNEDEATGVRRVFELYLETGSLQATAKALEGIGVRPKLPKGRNYRHVAEGRWTLDSVRTLLSNYAYIGKREINRRFKNEDKDFLKSWQQYQIVDAAWPALVSQETFDEVQRLLKENYQKERARYKEANHRVFLLSGILRCGECGMALIGQAAHGRSSVHRYYAHKYVPRDTVRCKIKRFRADEIEAAVVEHLDEILWRAGRLEQIETNIRKVLGTAGADHVAERDRVQKELVAVEREVESAFKLHMTMGDNPEVAALVKEKLEKMAEQKRKLTSYRNDLVAKIERNADAKEARAVIEDRAAAFKKGWPRASVAVQKRLLRRVLDKLVYRPDGLYTYFVTDRNLSPADNPTARNGTASGGIPEAVFLQSGQRPAPEFLSGGGSLVLGSGGDGGSRTHVRKRSITRFYKRSSCF